MSVPRRDDGPAPLLPQTRCLHLEAHLSAALLRLGRNETHLEVESLAPVVGAPALAEVRSFAVAME